MESNRDHIAFAILKVAKCTILHVLEALRDEPMPGPHGAYTSIIDVVVGQAENMVYNWDRKDLICRLIAIRYQLSTIVRLLDTQALRQLMIPSSPNEIVELHRGAICDLIVLINGTISDIYDVNQLVV